MNSIAHNGRPVFLRADQSTIALKNILLGTPDSETKHREEFLQRLVHDQPGIIPMDEIEPAFTPLIPVCMELPTSAGYVDNFWITPAGGLVFGECKLVRNPQSRREVVAQALDYARAVTGWHYDNLEDAVRKALKDAEATLWGAVNAQTDLDEQRFIDAVERRLRFGRLMILIISDGLHEGVEALATYLQLHAGVHAGLALLNLSIWEGLDGGLLVVPRVPLRTVLVERGIVRIEGTNSARIDPPAKENAGRSTPNIPKPTTASEPEFYAQLEERLPGLSERLRSFVASLSDIGVVPEFGKSLFLRWQSPQGQVISAGTIEPGGSVWLLKTVTDARAIGHQAAGERYLENIAHIINGTVKRSENGSIDVRSADGRAVRLPALLQSTDEWKKAIASLIGDVASSN